jgi:hypothetical protein
LIDRAGIWPLHDERPQRAGGGLQDRHVGFEGLHRNLKPKRSERITYPLETGTDVSRLLQTGGCGEAASKVLTRLAKCSLSDASGKLLDQDPDQLSEPPFRELDPFEFRRDAVHLRRASGSRSAPTAATFERDREESRFRQSIEAAARDVVVETECHRNVLGGKRAAPAARVQKNPAKPRIAGRC